MVMVMGMTNQRRRSSKREDRIRISVVDSIVLSLIVIVDVLKKLRNINILHVVSQGPKAISYAWPYLETICNPGISGSGL